MARKKDLPIAPVASRKEIRKIMANPSPQAIALIRKRIADWSPSDDTIAATLNSPTVANPVPQPQVPKPFLTRDLMGTLDQAALGRLQALPSLSRLLDDIERQEPGRLDNWLGLLQASGTITPAQAQAMGAIVHATQPDPAYRPLLSWAEVNLGRAVDAQDIKEARPNG